MHGICRFFLFLRSSFIGFDMSSVLTGKKAYEFEALFTLCCVKIFSRNLGYACKFCLA